MIKERFLWSTYKALLGVRRIQPTKRALPHPAKGGYPIEQSYLKFLFQSQNHVSWGRSDQIRKGDVLPKSELIDFGRSFGFKGAGSSFAVKSHEGCESDGKITQPLGESMKMNGYRSNVPAKGYEGPKIGTIRKNWLQHRVERSGIRLESNLPSASSWDRAEILKKLQAPRESGVTQFSENVFTNARVSRAGEGCELPNFKGGIRRFEGNDGGGESIGCR